MRWTARRAHRRRQRVTAIGAGLATAAALGGGAFAVWARGRRRGRRQAAAPQEWRCDCGQAFRVAGVGRHRVYWLPGAPDGQPVMSDGCPRCGRALPADAAAVVGA